MSLASVDNVRALGNLPGVAQLPDSVIEPHLDSAARELRSWIGFYESTSTGDKVTDCNEAECCICIAYLQPVLQKLYVQGIAEDVDPPSGEWLKTADSWIERGKSRVRDYIEDYTERKKVGWYAI